METTEKLALMTSELTDLTPASENIDSHSFIFSVPFDIWINTKLFLASILKQKVL